MKYTNPTLAALRCGKKSEKPRERFKRRFRPVMRITGIVLALSTANAVAQTSLMEGIEAKINNKSYIVSGESLLEIRRELSRRGPRGKWALTAWQVYWNQRCDVRFEATVTLPRVIGLSRLEPRDRDKVEDMLLALELHEKIHLRTGFFAAEEVKRYACENPEKIIDYWIHKNDQLDKETQNGRAEGVTLD